MHLCIVCHQRKPIDLICQHCQISFILERRKLTPGLRKIDSLFNYRGIVRDLLLAAKVNRDLGAFELIIELFKNHFITEFIQEPITAVMPMPSSLWGRLRGKFDLAFHLSQVLARMTNRPMVNAPWLLGWHTRKRAQYTEKTSFILDLPPLIQNKPTVLVIDDIVTTGESFHRLCRALPSQQLALFTFAGAPRLLPTLNSADHISSNMVATALPKPYADQTRRN